MAAAMTPSTAHLYSILGIDPFETPQAPCHAAETTEGLANALLNLDGTSQQNVEFWAASESLSTASLAPNQPASSEEMNSLLYQKYTSCGIEGLSEDVSRPVFGARAQAAPPTHDYDEFRAAIERRFSRADKLTQQVADQTCEIVPPTPDLSHSLSVSSASSSRLLTFSPTTIAENTIVENKIPDAHSTVPSDAAQARKPRRKRTTPTAAEKQAKKAAFLERNRVAAGKCRSKKRDWMQQLQEEVKVEAEKNKELRLTVEETMEELEVLRGMFGECEREDRVWQVEMELELQKRKGVDIRKDSEKLKQEDIEEEKEEDLFADVDLS